MSILIDIMTKVTTDIYFEIYSHRALVCVINEYREKLYVRVVLFYC